MLGCALSQESTDALSWGIAEWQGIVIGSLGPKPMSKYKRAFCSKLSYTQLSFRSFFPCTWV